jgi:hypothetical protein
MRRAVTILLLLALLSCDSFAQDSEKKKGLFYSDEIKIQSSYDKFDDLTLVMLTPMSVSNGLLDELGVYAGFGYPGKQQREPKVITFGFVYSVLADIPSPQFSKKRDLILLINGARLPLGETSYASEAKSTLLGTVRTETMSLHLSPELFTRIVTAKTIEGRLGAIDFTLTDRHLLALSKILAQTWQG